MRVVDTRRCPVRKLNRVAAAVSLATLAGSMGCSAGAFTNPLSLGKSKPDSTLAAAPPFDRSYDELASAQRDRKMASPALGMGDEVEPTGMKKFSNSVSNNSVTKGLKSAWGKTTSSTGAFLTSRKGIEPSATSMYSETGDIDADFLVAFAKNEVAKENYAGAIVKYEGALKLDKTNKGALLGLAHVYDAQGNLNKATTYYRQAVKAHPKDAAAHNDLGLCYARQNRLQDAGASLDQAVKLAPENPLYRNNIAKVLVEMGYAEPALAHMTEVHGEAIAHYNVGCLLYERGQVEESLDHFSLAFEKDRTMTAAYEWAVSVQQELSASNTMLAQHTPADAPVTATDNRLASQQTSTRRAPQLTPSWASDADHSTQPAAAPSPDAQNGYYTVEPDPSSMTTGNPDSSYRLPPVDTAYRAPSRY
jgi:tetratricopeptide (TPR) repeat protein